MYQLFRTICFSISTLFCLGSTISAQELSIKTVSNPINWVQHFQNRLLCLSDSKLEPVDASILEKKKYILLYFAASWCPPCRQFTPKLIEFYENARKHDTSFEIIFINQDRSELSMIEYIIKTDMPWPVLRYKQDLADPFIQSVAGSGIPFLILLDAQGNKLVDSFTYEDGAPPKYVGPEKVVVALGNYLLNGKPKNPNFRSRSLDVQSKKP